ncbi:hypothetical protein C8Q77DRAFT_364413 [Trametes polyzona]|nr:hypothetical protein C8Q77DRAFT_364413 [Trametes polyzona]
MNMPHGLPRGTPVRNLNCASRAQDDLHGLRATRFSLTRKPANVVYAGDMSPRYMDGQGETRAQDISTRDRVSCLASSGEMNGPHGRFRRPPRRADVRMRSRRRERDPSHNILSHIARRSTHGAAAVRIERSASAAVCPPPTAQFHVSCGHGCSLSGIPHYGGICVMRSGDAERKLQPKAKCFIDLTLSAPHHITIVLRATRRAQPTSIATDPVRGLAVSPTLATPIADGARPTIIVDHDAMRFPRREHCRPART